MQLCITNKFETNSELRDLLFFLLLCHILISGFFLPPLRRHVIFLATMSHTAFSLPLWVTPHRPFRRHVIFLATIRPPWHVILHKNDSHVFGGKEIHDVLSICDPIILTISLSLVSLLVIWPIHMKIIESWSLYPYCLEIKCRSRREATHLPPWILKLSRWSLWLWPLPRRKQVFLS